ncbi:MAG TPA: hypothetical protein VFG05_02640 [Methylocella sp.]|nr:hypothetical protein [Methylocella sp.]
MPDASDIRWFKEQFHKEIVAALPGTPFDLDMLTALACQETGEIWPILRKKPELTTDEILALCVGDTLDADKGRRAFPKTKAELLAAPHGAEMFAIARKALLDMAAHIKSYRPAAARPSKFVHGFGVWQYDLQFFKVEPQYFLERRYEKLSESLKKALQELRSALKKLGLERKPSLSALEMAKVAIAYNTGRFDPRKGLKQGYFDGKRYYGERIYDYILLSRTVPAPGGSPAIPPPAAGAAVIPPPSPVTAAGQAYVVDTRVSPLRLRSEPRKSVPLTKNVIAELPDGHPVRAVSRRRVNGFLEVETSLFGAHLHGFVWAAYLKRAPETVQITVEPPAPAPPDKGIVAASMPRKPGTITKRTDIAGAHSLNEPGQPGRKGTTPEELTAELQKIIDWLAVEKPAHKRYRPHGGLTFCNIYAHDYCHLAGVYLPRVWWTPRALLDLQAGKSVRPLLENTITEMRANDLFRWLRDHGLQFGWRQTGSADKLQQAANQGGIGLIAARRKQDGRSGHITLVVPENGDLRARRDAAGEVVAPLQSQAGSVNFRFGTGKPGWWKEDRFAESAFWIHA